MNSFGKEGCIAKIDQYMSYISREAIEMSGTSAELIASLRLLPSGEDKSRISLILLFHSITKRGFAQNSGNGGELNSPHTNPCFTIVGI